MPSSSFPTELSEEEAKSNLLEICRSPTSAQNLERIVRCLLQFWDSTKCCLNVGKDFVPDIFESLKFGPNSVETTEISDLSILDVKAFLHLCLHCCHVRSERLKEKTNVRKHTPLATSVDQLTTDWQRNWWRAAWALCHGSGKSDDRRRLQEGMEVLRLKSKELPELPLLVSTAAMLEGEVPEATRYGGTDTKAISASDYAQVYWRAIDQILEKDRIVQPKPDALFYAGLPPLPRSRRDHYRSLAQYYRALNVLLHGKEDEGISILERLETSQAFYALAHIYKTSADKVVGRQGDSDVEVRRKALLLKAKSALQSTMDKMSTQASNGAFPDINIASILEAIDSSLSAGNSQPNAAEAASPTTPVGQSTMTFQTPPSRFSASRFNVSSARNNFSTTLEAELGQSVSFALRSLTQTQDKCVDEMTDHRRQAMEQVRQIMEQNRALTEQNRTLATTCEGMVAQLREMTLTNRALVDEIKDMRRENAQNRSASSVGTAYNSTPAVPPIYYGQLPQQPLQQYPTPQPALSQLQQYCQQYIPPPVQQQLLPPQLPIVPAPPQQPIAPALPSQQPIAHVNHQQQLSSSSTAAGHQQLPQAPQQQPSSFSTAPAKPPSGVGGIFGAPSKPLFGASSNANTSTDTSFAGLAAQGTTASPATPFQGFQGFKGFEGTGKPLFADVKATSTPSHARQESENDDSTDAPFEATAEFQPAIPLPPLVEAKSGEEDEEILFQERAKLYVWGADVEGKEGFKERGLGILKILKHRQTGKIRLLMRREQVLKICANHAITGGMKLTPMKNSDRAFTWACQDFADGEVKNEMFAIRFKEIEQAQKFKEVFETASDSSASPSKAEPKAKSPEKVETKPQLSTMEMFKPKPGSWECKDCYTRNDSVAHKCACCGAASPNAPAGATASTPAPLFSTTAFPAAASTPTSGSRFAPPKFGLPPSTTSENGAPAASIFSSTTVGPTSGAGGLFGASKTIFGASSNSNTGVAPTGSPATPFQGFKGFEGSGKVLFGDVKATSTPSHTRQESENDDSNDALFEPTAEFKPVIPLPALVEAKSGEEDEEVLFQERAKLFRWGTDVEGKEGFKERGLGIVKLLKHRQTGKVRLLMRREQVLKICANHVITPEMKLSPMKNSDRAFTWHCQDFADGEVKNEMFAIRFKEIEQAQKFKEAFEAAVASSSSSSTKSEPKEKLQDAVESKPQFSTMEMFKPKPGSWECKDCYSRNNSDVMKCACCGAANPNDSTAASSTASAPLFSKTMFPPPSTPATASTLPPPKFGLPPTTTSNETPTSAPSSSSSIASSTGGIFGASKPIFGTSSSNVKTGMTFAAVAAHGTPAATASPATPFQGFQGFKGFEGTGKPLFGDVKTTSSTPDRTRQESENDDSTDAPFEPTAEFKPVIPLPALIEAKSGEEDEEAVFHERAKLYVWGADVEGKEGFKERGLGDLKILKHRQTGKCRVLMRREQVLKICANHVITPEMKLSPMKNSDRAFTWACQDFTDGELKNEMFAVRFKEAKQATKFKEAFDAAARSAVASPNKASGDGGDTKSKLNQPGNKIGSVEEINVVYQSVPNEEQKSMADKYQLPNTFYVDQPPCPGCIGCDNDEAQDEASHQSDRKEE